MKRNHALISNPCTWFVGPSETIKYTHESNPGDVLYHFSPNASGLSYTMEMNIIFFACNESDARIKLKKMLEFKLRTLQKHNGAYNNGAYVKNLLNNMDKWKITLVPTNQFFVVGWADNDTIL